MRKRIALFTNGWSSEFLEEAGQGILSGASIANADLFAFVNYSMRHDAFVNQKAEFSIFKVPDLKDFDGAILMASTFNLPIEFDYIEKELARADIPAISLEYKINGADYIGTDDYSGMASLVDHLITQHHVKKAVFIGGMPEHTGSNIRLKAVKDTLNRYGFSLPEDNILYGLFAAAPAVAEFQKWLANNPKFPDAVICANDIMAMGICDWLKDNGYVVPEDIIVTGFDCLKRGQDFSPSLTTVNREWYSMGIRSVEKLLSKMSGKETTNTEEAPTYLVCGESCGCKMQVPHSASKMLRKTDANKLIDGFSCDQHFRHMYIAMRRASNKQELSDSLSKFFIKEGWLEGKDVMLAFNPDFFYAENWDDLEFDGFPEKMELICNIKNKKRGEIELLPTSKSIFHIASSKSTCGIYFFVPIRVDTVCPGYGMLSCDFSIFQKDVLYLWCRHMSMYTEQIKSNAIINQLNRRLQALSVTDALTDTYNRTGCETVMYPKVGQNQANDGQSVIMLADLDRLKYINDNFGHAHGDLAIKTAVKALRAALPEDYLIGRYGGDEFLITGLEKEKIDIDQFIQAALDRAQYEAHANKLSYNISISIGAIQLKKGESFDIRSCIQKLDRRLYKMKSLHHELLDK